MTQSMEGFLLGGKVAALKFPSVGTEHTLTVTDEPELRQQVSFEENEPLFWDEGKTQPRMQLVVTGTVDKTDGPDDDGMRRLYVKGELQKAVGQACREAGARGLEPGGKLWVKYTGDGTATGRRNPPKLYSARYKKPDAKVAAQADFLGNADGPGDQPPF